MKHPTVLPLAQARRAWLAAQRLDRFAPFGDGPEATQRAVEHLGYVQIDTINVIERCHHHILFSRIPTYRRSHLTQAQSVEKSVFEYWTHALAYISTGDYRLFRPAMERRKRLPGPWTNNVDPKDYRALLRRIRDEGALSIRDIDDDVLVEKEHLWASRKPSKRALQYGFYAGDLTISARSGMVKSYELTDRHFGWTARPKPSTPRQYVRYLLDRALRAQGIVSIDSICYGEAHVRRPVATLVEAAVRRKELVPVVLADAESVPHWIEPAALEALAVEAPASPVHILSPFDPLIIQRKRLALFFGYEHRFEAYVKPEQRLFGYFALPVLVDDEIVAAIDLKTDRQASRLLVQKWTWLMPENQRSKIAIEEALHRFERFQLARGEADENRPLIGAGDASPEPDRTVGA